MARDWVDRSGEMEVLVRVVAGGSLSAAARELGLSPSAVSRILARIETRLGVRLLLRTTRALALTPEGEAYHRACLRILADLAEAEREVTEQAALRGWLRLNVSLPFGNRHVLPLLPEFLRLHPGIRLDISLSDTVIDLVLERADVAIRVGALPDSRLTARKLADNPRVVVASPEYIARRGKPAAPEDLAGHDCLGFNFRRAMEGWPFRIQGQVRVLPVPWLVQANNGETVRQLAIAGLGIARLGLFHVAEDLAAGQLVSLLADYDAGEVEPIHVVFIGGANVPGRVRAFVDFLVARLSGGAIPASPARSLPPAPRSAAVPTAP
ncbi:LysR family transcriptional regulator [Humitalea rosea]|uniref:LysR family transcriptional regulator n=1 Tax=Humitalea rosea TaxID=990373 RepID=A0A2W7KDG5_9PROT|nr:LysR family transcriptional regulator [Humitalea rosea]PZW45642.1 LysR family transcriptional regulator [Humitalea rosea]